MLTSQIRNSDSSTLHRPNSWLIESMRWHFKYHMCKTIINSLTQKTLKVHMTHTRQFRFIITFSLPYINMNGRQNTSFVSSMLHHLVQYLTCRRLSISSRNTITDEVLWRKSVIPCYIPRFYSHICFVKHISSYPMCFHRLRILV